MVVILLFDCITSFCQDSYRDHEAFRRSQAYTSILADVYAKLKPVFQKYYPAARMKNAAANGLHFEYEVTNFDFSTTDQPSSGSKRENPIQKGPRHGGILCSVYLENGKYNGQLGMPRLEDGRVPSYHIDRKFYKELLMAPYSVKLDTHLWACLSYSPEASEAFLKDYIAIMTDFEK